MSHRRHTLFQLSALLDDDNLIETHDSVRIFQLVGAATGRTVRTLGRDRPKARRNGSPKTSAQLDVDGAR